MTDWSDTFIWRCRFYPGRDCPGCTSVCERINKPLGDIEVMEQTSKPGGPVVKWADPAMFSAKPMTREGEPVKPRVTVISMTPNPLRVMAAACEMYKGYVIHSPHNIPEDVALKYLEDMQHTSLQAPLEYVDVHFLIEGISRALMDQLRTQRTAVFSAESLRFAVKENAVNEIVLPPSLHGLDIDDPRMATWLDAIDHISRAYTALVNAGIPAEDARGLLPMNIATRIHYKTNLRNLMQHSGYRLCSQAQHEWKILWLEIVRAITRYGPAEDRWQQLAISRLFKPICYQTGKCEFNSSSDRYCSIRERVEAHHRLGHAPDTWTNIDPREPLHQAAARES